MNTHFFCLQCSLLFPVGEAVILRDTEACEFWGIRTMETATSCACPECGSEDIKECCACCHCDDMPTAPGYDECGLCVMKMEVAG